MSVKVFVPGRPGSGKSEAIRNIVELANSKKLSTMRLKDYSILHEMFVLDKGKETRQFHQTDYGGFDVCDFSVLDTALEQLDKKIQTEEKKADLIFIEFARQDYKKAFKLFEQTSLDTSYFLFIESELEDCIDRIYRRVYERQKPDHHFVSEYIMRTYYNEDNWSYMKNTFEKDFGIQEQHVKTIYNDNSLKKFLEEVNAFASFLFQQEFQKVPVPV